MSSLSVGDMAQNFTLTRSGTALKTSIQQLSNALVSGLADDTAAHLSGDLNPLAGLKASLARLDGYKAVTTEAGLFADTMQTAFGQIIRMASSLSQSLLAGASPSAPPRTAALGVDAAQKFEATVSALKTRVGDRSLFSGVDSTTTPLPDGAALLDTLETVVAGALTAADVQTALDDWFSQPTGYAATYQGGAQLAPVAVAPGELARIDITAMDPTIRNTLKGFALAALIDRGVLSTSQSGQADLLRRSGEALLTVQNDLGNTTARLGTTQQQIDQAAQRNAAEATALNIALSDMLSIDSFAVATSLQQTQTQLETLYALTARMSRLSLVNFL